MLKEKQKILSKISYNQLSEKSFKKKIFCGEFFVIKKSNEIPPICCNIWSTKYISTGITIDKIASR